MEIDNDAAKRKIELAIEATAKGKIYFSKDNYKEEFNRGCDHVALLFESAFKLYQCGLYPPAAFISITAIEEIAKLDIAVFRREEHPEPARSRREDLLFNHKAKHSIALQEVIAIGDRLPKVIGEERVRELLNMAETGELIGIREASLYTDILDGKFTVPSERVTKNTSRDLLLLAFEVWNDRLVGLTNYTYDIDKRMMEIFDCVKNSYHDNQPDTD
ncbi:MAG: AbiV family abortive infection protein [Thermodesulfovibrionales bacterium]